MPFRCSVPLCNGNYDNGPKVSVFSFPSDENLRQKWIRAIHRDDFKPSASSKVCELHFAPDDIERETVLYDSRTGRRLSAPLYCPRLKKGAVPCILPNCPAYLSSSCSSREEPGARRKRFENEHLQTAIQKSLQTKETEDRRHIFKSYAVFLDCLSNNVIPSPWTLIKLQECTIFAIMHVEQGSIKASVVVDEKLQLSAYFKGKPLEKCENFTLPFTVNDIFDILKILNYVEHFQDPERDQYIADVLCQVQELLQGLEAHLDERDRTTLSFIRQQLQLLNMKKNKLRYSSEFLIFACLMYSISPHAYKFLRHSENLILPHFSTIRKICAEVHLSPLQDQHTFLKYMKEKISQLEERDKTVILMVDAIHLKPFLDFKGGNILGMAFNCTQSATSAHVFMVRSLLSGYKDVAHILPVRTLTAQMLHEFVKKVILGLEDVGFQVVCVVTDNNSINRKCMTLFADPPKLKIAYAHPHDSRRCLFYVIDAVHIFKCVRNNWLNQRNYGQCMFYPNFESGKLETASFLTLKKLHELEHEKLLKHGYGLTLKALCPSNLERQNVKLVLQVFSKYVSTALVEIGNKHSLEHSETTSVYIELILRWWNIVNVKTPHKGVHLRDVYQKPLTLLQSDESAVFLYKFLDWLDLWQKAGCDTGMLSKETHLAITHTTYALIEMTRYCIEELNFGYFLPGKVQTDVLEERFGKYRMLAGSQYHVSVRQVLESEKKLRLQDTLPLFLNSNTRGKIPIDVSQSEVEDDVEVLESSEKFSSIYVEENELQELVDSVLPVITYLGGYSAYSLLKKLKCEDCRHLLVMDKECVSDNMYKLVSDVDRGGLHYPHTDIVNVVAHTYIVLQKLLSADYESQFLREKNQRRVAVSVAFHVMSNELISVGACAKHDTVFNTRHIISVVTNSLLKNYFTIKNDKPKAPAQKRKLQTLTGKNSN